jgi:hypothetical protein
MTYDLRRLRLTGLIRRIEHTNRYVLTPDGLRTAIFYTKLHNRLLRPLLAAGPALGTPELRHALRTVDVAGTQRVRYALHRAWLLAGMSFSPGVDTAESGHLAPNRSPASSLVLLVGISHHRPATFVWPRDLRRFPNPQVHIDCSEKVAERVRPGVLQVLVVVEARQAGPRREVGGDVGGDDQGAVDLPCCPGKVPEPHGRLPGYARQQIASASSPVAVVSSDSLGSAKPRRSAGEDGA